MADTDATPPPGGLEPRVAVLEQIARSTVEVLARIEARLDRIEDRMNRIEDRMDRYFWRLLTLYLGGMGAVIAGGGFLLIKVAVKVGAL